MRYTFGPKRSYVKNLKTGHESAIVRQRGVYVMELKVLQPNTSSSGKVLAALEEESKRRLLGGLRRP